MKTDENLPSLSETESEVEAVGGGGCEGCARYQKKIKTLKALLEDSSKYKDTDHVLTKERKKFQRLPSANAIPPNMVSQVTFIIIAHLLSIKCSW